MTLGWILAMVAQAAGIYPAWRLKLRMFAAFLAYDFVTSVVFYAITGGDPYHAKYAPLWLMNQAGILPLWGLAAAELVALELDRREVGGWLLDFGLPVTALALLLGAAGSLLFGVEVARPSREVLLTVLELKRSLAIGLTLFSGLLSLCYAAFGQSGLALRQGWAMVLFFGLQAYGYLLVTALRPGGWSPEEWNTAANTIHQFAMAGYFAGWAVVAGGWIPARAVESASVSPGRGDRAESALPLGRPEPPPR